MKKWLCLILLGCLSLSACSTQPKSITVESNVENFDMNNYDMPEIVTIESGRVLYDQNGLKITTDSLESDSGETFLILNLENTSDTDITLVCESSAINNFMIETPFYADLAAGESTLTGINFTNSDLNACEITTITDIDFTLTAYESETYTLLYETNRLSVETNQYGQYEQTINTDGTMIYNKDNIQIVSKGFTLDEHWGDVVVLLILNQSDKNIYFGIDEGLAIANDTEYEVTFGCNVPAGHNAIRYIYFQDNDGHGSNDITTASTTFALTDTDSWEIIDTTPKVEFTK